MGVDQYSKNLLVVSGKYDASRDYWLARLRGGNIAETLPHDLALLPPSGGEQAGEVSGKLGGEAGVALRRMCRDSDLGLYLILLSGVTYLLFRLTGDVNVLEGMPAFAQSEPPVNDVLPFFIGIREEWSFADLLSAVRKTVVEAVRNRNFPLDAIEKRINSQLSDCSFPDYRTVVALSGLNGQADNSKSDLYFLFEKTGGDVNLTLSYRPEKYSRPFIEEAVKVLVGFFDAAAKDPAVPLVKIGLPGDEEKRILDDFNGTFAPFPKGMTLHGLFSEKAALCPDRVALEFGDESLTYSELDRRSDGLAHYLRSAGVATGDVVAVMARRSIGMVVGIYAVLKAGAAYLPIDPEYPRERVRFMLDDSGARVLLVDGGGDAEGAPDGVTAVDLGNPENYLDSGEKCGKTAGPDDLCYIIYTSGSTGRPKGVAVRHRNAVNFICAQQKDFPLGENDSFLFKGSYCFDVTVAELFGWFLGGGKLVILEPGAEREPRKILDAVVKHGVTHVNFVPSMFNVFLGALASGELAEARSLRYILAGGEALSRESVRAFANLGSSAKLWNLYGPTESTVYAARFATDGVVDGGTVPIGKPVYNTRAYIVNKLGLLQPVGVEGELCLSGASLSAGYFNSQELTGERFVKNPFSRSGEDGVMYKTGDLARWLPDGNIEYLGRLDHQVKIRGFRIELGEIENVLLESGDIREAAVAARTDKTGAAYLCAYYAASGKVEVPSLRAGLLKRLPEYMIPSRFVELAELPLNSNGKLDRKALPEPENSGAEYVAPQNETEARLLGLCRRILGVEKLGMRDNFFELGGNSLKAATLIAEIYREFHAELQFAKVFKSESILELAKYIESSEKRSAGIGPAAKREFYPLSFAQKRLFVLNQMEGDSVNYNISIALRLSGSLDVEKLENTFLFLIRRHEALRTSFHLRDGEPVQRVHETVDFHIDRVTAEEENLLSAVSEFIRPFKLSEAPLLRARLIETGGDSHVLVVDMHHIVSDGASLETISRELFALYGGKALAELELQYRDFSEWQNSLRSSGDLEKKEQYWLEAFGGELPVLNLPTDFTRPAVQSFEGDKLSYSQPPKLAEDLRKLAASTGTTLFMVLLAAFDVLLHRYSGQEDIIVGSPAAGRLYPELSGIVGMFVNTLALRNAPTPEKTFSEFLEEVKTNALEAYDNQEYQFEELVEKLGLHKDVSRNPLFDVMFVLQNIGGPRMEADGLTIAPLAFHNKVSKFDLTLETVENGGNLTFNFEYCTRLFKKETVERLAGHYVNILAQIIGDPKIRLSDIDLLSPEEKHLLLAEFNDTAAPYPRDKTVSRLFEEQAKRTPGRVAVTDGDGSVTYGELNQKANRLARALRAKGAGKNSVVALFAERSIEMSVAVLAVLKAGGAYLPISPDYPADRAGYMLRDSGAKVLVAANADLGGLDLTGVDVVDLKDEGSFPEDGSNLEAANGPDDPAYVIYTSGSTGRPKGAVIRHYSLVNRLHWMQKKYPLGEDDAILQKTPYTFDVSVWELVWWSLAGARLCHLAPGAEKDPGAIADAVERYGITTLHFVPSMLGVFLQYVEESGALGKLKSLRRVFASGEALKPKLVAKFNGLLYESCGATLHNLYGPTEAAIDVSYFDCPTGENPPAVPIGKPIDNISLYVLDKRGGLLPVGVPGELYIAGDGLAKGYLNRPELTDEKFVKNPYALGSENKLMYRTGDVARWLPDGNLEYIGRADFQVKIRGNRVEPGEIEAELQKLPAVKEAVVASGEDGDGSKYLCAYYVSDTELTVAELRTHLLQNLPEYMVPQYFVRLERIPLTKNGKADRKALPEPDGKINSGDEWEAPKNKTERRLAEIWKEVLSLEDIGVNSRFFNLGGDSIKAISLISRVNGAFGSNLGIRDLYLSQSVRELAEAIGTNAGEDLKADLEKGLLMIEEEKQKLLADGEFSEELRESAEDFYPLSPIQQGIVFFAKLRPDEPIYHDQFTYLLKFRDFDIVRFNKALTLLMEKHPMLRTSFDLEHFGKPFQIVHKRFSSSVGCTDLSQEPKSVKETRIKDYLEADLKHKFDFEGELLWRMGVFKLSEEAYCVALSFQHAILDGWSVAALGNELVDVYSRLGRGESFGLQALKSSYRDYVAINLCRRASDTTREFWREFLRGYSRLKLPFNISSKRLGHEGGVRIMRRDLGPALLGLIEGAAKDEGCTVNELCLAAFLYLLKVVTTDGDIVAGVVTHDRPALEDGEKVLGCFLNTVPIRVKLEGKTGKRDLLEKTRRSLIDAKSNELFLSDIANAVGETNASGNPIFDVLFNFTDFHVLKGVEDTGVIDETDEGLRIEPSEMTNTLFDLEVSKTLDRFGMQIKYSPDYFEDADIETALGLYVRILGLLSEKDTGDILSGEDLITPEQKRKAVFEYNDTAVTYPKEKSMHGLFEEQAKRAPERVALVFGDEKLTYGELDGGANRLARLLIDKGVAPGDNVALVARRGFGMIIGMFAILKCGAAYVPIDPEYPAARKEYIAANSEIAAVLSDGRYDLPEDGLILMDAAEYGSYPADDPGVEADPEKLAYVIYTSGSTGRPKGVMIEHRSAVNLISWVNREFEVGQNDATLFVTSMCFDLSVYDVFGTLAAGGRVVIADKGQLQDPEELKKLLKDERITFWDSVPSTMNYLVDYLGENDAGYRQEDLRLAFLSGDWIPVKLPGGIRKFFPNARSVSLGGATEGTVWSIYHPIGEVSSRQTSIPYGRPIDNSAFYILDGEGALVPPGVAGELYIGGAGVARGYMNDKDRTAAAFVKDRFSGDGGRMYKTGDLGRMLPDGDIEFLGRKDHQVKIRGFRVELGEIENQLLKHPLVREAVAADRVDSGGNRYLCAYVVWNGEPDVPGLKEHLARYLPEYMIPTYFVAMEKVPLTQNGKIDRKSLPQPSESAPGAVKYQAPTTETEEIILRLWEELLEVRNFGINDNFFDIGGNSLLLIRMQARLNRLYPGKVAVTDLFRIPTVKKIAEFLQNDGNKVRLSPVPLPQDYFASGGFEAGAGSLDLSVSGGLYEKLGEISARENLELPYILLSMYVYLFADVSGKDSVCVQLMLDGQNSAVSLETDVSKADSVPRLMQLVRARYGEAKDSGRYGVEELGSLLPARDKTSVVPLIYDRDLFTLGTELTDYCDVVLSFRRGEGGLRFRLEYSGRLAGEKMRELFGRYGSLLDALAKEYV